MLQGKITSYDSYHKRSKVRYDDDEEEWLALPRQRFISLLPRARSAGCTPSFMAAMQALGAANMTGSAQVGLLCHSCYITCCECLGLWQVQLPEGMESSTLGHNDARTSNYRCTSYVSCQEC